MVDLSPLAIQQTLALIVRQINAPTSPIATALSAVNGPLYVQNWQPNVAYTANLVRMAPDGTPMQCAAAHTAGASFSASVAAPILSAASPSASGGTLSPTTYYYVVTGTNALGETVKSAELSATTTGSNGSVTLTFSLPSGLTGARVYRGTATGVYGGYFAVGSASSYVDTGASFTASGVTPPTTSTALLWRAIGAVPGSLAQTTAAATYVAKTAQGGSQLGANGVNAAGFYSGIGAPATTLGNAGDAYLRTDTPTVSLQRLYIKTTSNAWTGVL